MIKKEIINGVVFIEQTSFHIYRSDEANKKNDAFLITSNRDEFEHTKELIKNGTLKLRAK